MFCSPTAANSLGLHKKEVFTVGVEVFVPPDFFESPHGCLGSRNSRHDIVIIAEVVCNHGPKIVE
jgi:hypothetical protein